MSDRHLRPERPHRPSDDHSDAESDADGRFGRNHADRESVGEGAQEREVLAEVAQMLAEGVLEPVPADWEFVVTEVVAPGIEIGFSRRKSAACRYPGHRPHDWVTHDGRLVCGTCHPPASTEAKR